MAKPYRRKDSPYWWIAPMINGAQQPRSSGTTDYDEASDMLKVLSGRISQGEPITHRTGRATVNELLDDVVTKYKIDRRITDDNDVDLKRSLLCRMKHLRPALGHLRSGQIDKSIINRYAEDRQKYGAANSTINRELAEIKKAFRMAYPEKVLTIPKIEMLPEDNERDAYYEPEQFRAIVSHCSPVVCAILSVAYITGWRITSIRTLQWRNVDLIGGFVRLSKSETKNRLAVRWPLKAGLREVFEEQRAITDEVQKRKGMVIPWVFHRDGQPVASIRTAFDYAREKAGLPGYRIHDFRGTATINLLETGADLSKVMGMIGFKSVQMVQRYAEKRGLREKSITEVGEMLEARMGTTLGTTKKKARVKE